MPLSDGGSTWTRWMRTAMSVALPLASQRSRHHPVVRIQFRIGFDRGERAGVTEQQEGNGEVVLLGEDGHLPHRFPEPDAPVMIEAGAPADQQVLPDRQRGVRDFDGAGRGPEESARLQGGVARARPQDEAVAGDDKDRAPGRVAQPAQRRRDQRDPIAVRAVGDYVEIDLCRCGNLAGKSSRGIRKLAAKTLA